MVSSSTCRIGVTPSWTTALRYVFQCEVVKLLMYQQDVTLLVQQLEPLLLQLQKVLFHLEPVTLEPVTLIQQEWTWVQLVLPRLNCWIHWCCRCLVPREGLFEAQEARVREPQYSEL